MRTDLTKENIIKGILLFALPIYIGQLFSMLYGMIDTRIVGSVLGESSLAAVSVSAPLSELIIEFENGVSCGFGIIMAQQVGAGKMNKIRKTIATSYLMISCIVVLISILCIIFIDPILEFLNVEAGILTEARQYIIVILIGMMFLAIYNLLVAILRSLGYFGVIITEPIVWGVMVIPLILRWRSERNAVISVFRNQNRI